MDLNDDPPNGGGDKRKSEAESDFPSSTKKFCSNTNTKSDSNDFPSEVSTSNIQDFLASSSDLKVTSQQSDESEKLSLLVQSCSYIENQSHNIGSTTESLDGSQSEVSLNDINIDPFISGSCETSQTSMGTGVDSSGNVSIIGDSFSVTGCLDAEVNESQISQIEMAVPTSSITLTLEKQCPEITSVDIIEKNLSSLETQVVSSSDQICSIEQGEDNSIKRNEEKVSTCNDIVSNEMSLDKGSTCELHVASTSTSEVINAPLTEDSSICLNQSNKLQKNASEQIHLSENETKGQKNEPLQVSVTGVNKITDSDSVTTDKNSSKNNENVKLNEAKCSLGDLQLIPQLTDKTNSKLPLPKDVKKNDTNSEISQANYEESVLNVPSQNLPGSSSIEQNLSSVILPTEGTLAAVLSCEEKLVSDLSGEENLACIFPDEENLASVLSGGENMASVLSGEENMASVLSGEENMASVLSGEENMASVLSGGENMASVLSGGENMASILSGGKNMATVLSGGENVANVLSSKENISSVLSSKEKMASVLSSKEKMASVLSSRESMASVISSRENVASVLSGKANFPSTLPDDKKLARALSGKDNLPSTSEKSLSSSPLSKENLSNIPLPEEKVNAASLHDKDKTFPTNLPGQENFSSSTSSKENLTTATLAKETLSTAPPSEVKLTSDHPGKKNQTHAPAKENLCNITTYEENLSSVKSIISRPCSLGEKAETSNKSLTFKESLKNISLTQESSKIYVNPNIPSESELQSQVPKIDSSFVLANKELCSPLADTENELDKKSEISTMEVDSTNTPAEGSSVDTPCDSGETSPCISTPIDSCQVSAAPSPIPKEDPNLASESLLYDESSMDTKDLADESMDIKEQDEVKPAKTSKMKNKKNAAENKKMKGKSTPMLVDEETRMSANGTLDLCVDEDSQSSTGTNSKREVRRYRCEVIVPESTETFTADKVNEYLWPLDGMGEHYFIQEHIAQYLGVMSFKRKYPDLRRRPIESQEKEYLKDLGLVSEIACDLGLTAVRSEDVLDVIFNDFPAKYEELQRVLRERKEKLLKEKGKVDYQVMNLDKSKMQEYSRKAALNSSKWNVAFNRERNEERRYSFDLQSFTLHIPLSHAVKLPPPATKLGSYPVTVLPGQYTDYCKKYTTGDLRGMPLQTVLSGPFTAEELAAEMQGVESDDDSAVTSFATCPEIKEEPEVPPVVDPLSAEKQPRCKVCNGGRARNKDGKPEPLIICGTCRTASHPTCIDLTLAMIDKIESYSWQCMDCKTCAQCNDPDDEERMIFCDMCDRGYHIYCVGLRKVPNGRWHCKECAVCFTCEARNPSGNEHIKNAEWQHEFKKDKDNKQLKYACTLCVPCDKYWKRRQFCSVCMKVYRSIPEDGMVRCSGCPKYVHKEGCSVVHDGERFCNICFKSRNKTALNHSRIIAAAKKKMATGNVMWK